MLNLMVFIILLNLLIYLYQNFIIIQNLVKYFDVYHGLIED